MYLEHFGLAVNPFGLSPKLDFLYKSETFEESMAHLIYGLDNQEAIVLITGAIGTGKTMALQSFLINLGSRFEFALITNTRLTAVELLKLTLEDLGVKFPVGCDKSDLLILFKEFLLEASKAGKRVLIVVDEAQNLSSEVLEEIRLLTNLGQGESQPVTIILVGQPELEATVNRPDLAQLRQRIRVHYNLDPLSRKEIEEYVHHRMNVAGCDRKAFSGEAIDAIFQESRGVPRLVNTMAGEGLLSAYVAGHDRVQANDIDRGKDLSFETGPTAITAPAPAPAPVPEPIPEPIIDDVLRDRLSETPTPSPPPPREESPPLMAPSTPDPAPRVDVPARRKRGMGGVMTAAVVAAVLVLTIGALYFMGFLDGVVAAIYPEDSAEPRQVVQQPADPVVVPPIVVEDTAVEEAAPEEETPVAVDPEPVAIDTPVEEQASVEPVGEESTTAIGESNTFIHISSFRTPERAESLKRRMSDVGPGIVSLMMEIRGDDWHRVYLGPYASREEAYMEAIRLKQAGTISFYRLTEIEPDQLAGQ